MCVRFHQLKFSRFLKENPNESQASLFLKVLPRARESFSYILDLDLSFSTQTLKQDFLALVQGSMNLDERKGHDYFYQCLTKTELPFNMSVDKNYSSFVSTCDQ